MSFRNQSNFSYTHLVHKVKSNCPACVSRDSLKKKGLLIKKESKFGFFLGCSRYPDCRYTCKFIKPKKPKHNKKRKTQQQKTTKQQKSEARKRKQKISSEYVGNRVFDKDVRPDEVKRQDEFLKNI